MHPLAVKDPAQASTHGSRHLKLVLRKEYPENPTYKVEAPVFDKNLCTREPCPIPVELATRTFSEEYKNHDEPKGITDPCPHTDFSNYHDHPVVKTAISKNMHWSRIVPVALYTDGVAYTNRDSFLGFFVRNLRTNKSYLCFLIRSLEN